MDNRYLVVLITAPSVEVAQQIAEALLAQRLAACVNILPGVQSLYTWEGSLHRDAEVLLLVKTRAGLFEEQLVPAVQKVHPYEVPEIIALPIHLGSQPYLDWIEDVTVSKGI
jgi:periplasmic divalent cation tolerance protein